MKVQKIVFTLVLAIWMATSIEASADDRSNSSVSTYGALYSSLLTVIVPTEFISSAMPTKISEFVSSLDNKYQKDFHAVRDDAIDYLATGEMSETLKQVVEKVQTQKAGEELSSSQVASMVIGVIGA